MVKSNEKTKRDQEKVDRAMAAMLKMKNIDLKTLQKAFEEK